MGLEKIINITCAYVDWYIYIYIYMYHNLCMYLHVLPIG